MNTALVCLTRSILYWLHGTFFMQQDHVSQSELEISLKVINTPAPGALLYSMWGNEGNEVEYQVCVLVDNPPKSFKQIYYSYQQTEFTLNKLTANGNLGNLLSATLQGCLAHVYMYAVVVPNLIWKHFFHNYCWHMLLPWQHTFHYCKKKNVYCTFTLLGQHLCQLSFEMLCFLQFLE